MAENLVQQHCWTEAEVLQGCNVCWVGNYTAGTGDKGKSYSTELCSLYRKLFRDRWLQRVGILRGETLPCVCVDDLSQKSNGSVSGFPGQPAVAQSRYVWRESPMSPHLTHQSRILAMMSKAMSCTLDSALGLLPCHRGSSRISIWTWQIKEYFLSEILQSSLLNTAESPSADTDHLQIQLEWSLGKAITCLSVKACALSCAIFSPTFGHLRPNRAAVDTMLLSACSSSTTGFLPAPVIIRYTPKSQSSTQKDRLPSAPPGCSWLLISSTILNYKEKGFAAEAMLFGIKKDSSFLLPPPPICFSCFIQNLLLWTLLDFLPF